MGAPVGCETTYFPATMSDRTHLEALLIALDASPIALERPNCRGWVGDYQISGKLGHVLADGAGFLLYVGTNESVRRWTNVKRQLSFCRLTQDGDDEGCLHLDRLPTEHEAKLIREAMGIRRRRHLSPEALAQARSALEFAAGRAKSPVPEPASAQGVRRPGSHAGAAARGGRSITS
jgi:hypothetical protein